MIKTNAITRIFLILTLLTVLQKNAFTQSYYINSISTTEMEQFSNDAPSTVTISSQVGGRYITASGTIRLLCVYVQFPDDNWQPSSTRWPKGQAPIYLNSTIDSVWSTNPTTGSLTDYFNQMSFNTLKIVGKSVSIVTPHTRGWYLNNGWRRADINIEVIRKLDETENFKQYDNWHFNSAYSHTDTSDNIVDMILMMWRNISADTVDVQPTLDLRPGGEASLGYYSSKFSKDTIKVDGGARTIKMGYYGNGSGVTVIQPNGSDLSPNTLWRYARHEFSHWLLGGNEYHTQYGTWGILSSYGTPSDCINTFERERLGWKNPNIIEDISTTQTIANITLQDFVTTGVSYKIKVPGGSSDEYYIIENHQRISVFDIPDANYSNTKGIYILKQKGTTGDGTGIITAEGRYNWSAVASEPNIYGSTPATLPVFQRGISNRINGYCRRHSIPWSFSGQSGTTVIHYERINGVTVKAPPAVFLGTGKDQFDLALNTVFSPASNPSSDLYSNDNKIGFEITGYNSSTSAYTFNIHINTITNASPSKPQDVQASLIGTNSIPISWTANTESDISGYDLYRSVYYDGATLSYTKVNSSLLTSTTYTDNPTFPSNLPAGKDVYWRYYVKAIDSQSKNSVPSEDYWLYVGKTISGTISGNTTLDGNRIMVGNVTVKGNITANSGITLYIAPNAVISFAKNISLNINGKINAQGTSSQSVTFKSTTGTTAGNWGSINFSGSSVSGSILKYCTIKCGTQIFVQNVPNITISFCTVQNMVNGVRFSGSNGWVTDCTISNPTDHGIIAENGATVSCYRNVITKSTKTGFGIIYNGGSYDYCYQNTIIGFNSGVGMLYGSSPTLGHPTNSGRNNHITGCSTGLEIRESSYPEVGYGNVSKYNSIHNNSKAAYVNNCPSYTIYAQYVYWGTTDPVQLSKLFTLTNVKQFNYSYPLSNCPWEGGSLKGSTIAIGSEQIQPIILSTNVNNLESNDEDVLKAGIKLRNEGKYIEAKQYLKSLIANQPLNEALYIELYKTQNDTTREDIIQYLSSLPVSAPPIAKLLLSYIHLRTGNIELAKQTNNKVIKQYSNSKQSKLAKLNNFYIALYRENDPEQASSLLTEISNKSELSIDDIELSLANQALEIYKGVASIKKDTKGIMEEKEGISAGYELFQNFPNPFNPTTVINYQLPEQGHINIKVYDLLGREVTTLVDEMKETGRYSVTFDGSNLSSGIYFIRMTIQQQEGAAIVQVRKMLLTK